MQVAEITFHDWSQSKLMTQHIRRSMRETLEFFDQQEVRADSDTTRLQKLPLPPELFAELERID